MEQGHYSFFFSLKERLSRGKRSIWREIRGCERCKAENRGGGDVSEVRCSEYAPKSQSLKWSTESKPGLSCLLQTLSGGRSLDCPLEWQAKISKRDVVLSEEKTWRRKPWDLGNFHTVPYIIIRYILSYGGLFKTNTDAEVKTFDDFNWLSDSRRYPFLASYLLVLTLCNT